MRCLWGLDPVLAKAQGPLVHPVSSFPLVIRAGFTTRPFPRSTECELACALLHGCGPNILNSDPLGSGFQLPTCVAEQPLLLAAYQAVGVSWEEKTELGEEPCFSICKLFTGSLSFCPTREVRESENESWDCPSKALNSYAVPSGSVSAGGRCCFISVFASKDEKGIVPTTLISPRSTAVTVLYLRVPSLKKTYAYRPVPSSVQYRQKLLPKSCSCWPDSAVFGILWKIFKETQVILVLQQWKSKMLWYFSW